MCADCCVRTPQLGPPNGRKVHTKGPYERSTGKNHICPLCGVSVGGDRDLLSVVGVVHV